MKGRNQFGELFRETRKGAGKNIGETARHLTVSITFLSDVERGTRPPLSPERIRAACEFLGVDPAPLLGAAAAQQGDFRMPASGLTATGMDAMAALQRGLPEYDDAFFEELLRLAQRGRGGKQG